MKDLQRVRVTLNLMSVDFALTRLVHAALLAPNLRGSTLCGLIYVFDEISGLTGESAFAWRSKKDVSCIECIVAMQDVL